MHEKSFEDGEEVFKYLENILRSVVWSVSVPSYNNISHVSVFEIKKWKYDVQCGVEMSISSTDYMYFKRIN